MPCYNLYDDDMHEGRKMKLEATLEHLEQANAHISYLTGCLCALFCCLERRNICKEVIGDASLNGDVKIDSIYELHKKHDKDKVKNLLAKLSRDEQVILRNILDKENISDKPIPTPTDSISDTKGL